MESQMRSLPRSTLSFATVLLVTIAAFGLGTLFGRSRSARRAEDSAPVVEAVKKVARLATVEMQVADVVKYEEVRKIVVFDVPKNATLRLRGTVLGGFDLAS